MTRGGDAVLHAADTHVTRRPRTLGTSGEAQEPATFIMGTERTRGVGPQDARQEGLRVRAGGQGVEP